MRDGRHPPTVTPAEQAVNSSSASSLVASAPVQAPPVSTAPAARGESGRSDRQPPAPGLILPPGDAVYRLRQWRHWLTPHAWQDTPCWLVSFVFHLTLLVALGLLTSPVPRRSTMTVLLLMPVAVTDDDALEADPVLVQRGERSEQGPKQDDHQRPNDQPVAASVSAPSAPVIDMRAKVAQLKEMMQGLQDWAASVEPQEQPPVPAPDAPASPRPTERLAKATQRIPDEDLPPQFAAQTTVWNRESLHQHTHADEIVQQFILYDIGQLRGEAANRARTAFGHLGPESIPALVRGLNRSAYIRASCPVGVLSSKLQSALYETDDPLLIHYALENVGRDVPQNQPHYGRVQALREELRKRFSDNAEVMRSQLVTRGIDAQEERARQLADMLGLTTRELIAVLDDTDQQRQVLAIVALSMRDHGSLHPHQRVDFARRLIPLTNSPDPVRRRESHRVLQNLALGADWAAGSAPTEMPGDQATWMSFWNEYERQRVIAPRVRSLLLMAQSLERRGKRTEATRRYRSLVEQYPASAEARVARERLSWSGL